MLRLRRVNTIIKFCDRSPLLTTEPTGGSLREPPVAFSPRINFAELFNNSATDYISLIKLSRWPGPNRPFPWRGHRQDVFSKIDMGKESTSKT